VNTIEIPIDWNLVVCDMCNEGFTADSKETGGCVVSSWAACPACVKRQPAFVSEASDICGPDETFFDFINRYRMSTIGAKEGDNPLMDNLVHEAIKLIEAFASDSKNLQKTRNDPNKKFMSETIDKVLAHTKSKQNVEIHQSNLMSTALYVSSLRNQLPRSLHVLMCKVIRDKKEETIKRLHMLESIDARFIAMLELVINSDLDKINHIHLASVAFLVLYMEGRDG